MRKLPTSMNNRQPASSSDSEWQDTVTPYANNPGRQRDRTVPLRNPPPSRNPSPLLSGTAFSADADHKPPRE